MPHLADHTHCTGRTACASGCPKDAITMERDRGLCLSGDRRSGLCAVRALHGGVPRPAGAASELHARCIRGLE